MAPVRDTDIPSDDSTGSPGPVDPGTPSATRQRLRHRVTVAKGRVEASAGGELWKRLTALDFIGQAMLFAAIFLLCLFPFLIVADALAHRSITTVLTRLLGLDPRAAADVGHLFTASHNTTESVTGASYVLFVLGGYAAVTALQALYEKAHQLQSRGFRDLVRRFVWLAITVGSPWWRVGRGTSSATRAGRCCSSSSAWPSIASSGGSPCGSFSAEGSTGGTSSREALPPASAGWGWSSCSG
jgi:hypothetical protein